MRSILKRCAGALIVSALVAVSAAGCSASATGEGGSEGGLAIEDFAGRKVLFEETPKRIVALGNGEVDIIYALGGTVTGRPEDKTGLFGDDARDVPIIGSVHTVDLEKIAVLQPDVVLGNYPINVNDIPTLASIGAKVVLTHANSIEDIRRQIELIGKLMDKEAKASELIAGLDAELAEVEAQQKQEQHVLMVYGAPGTFLAALPNSLAGNLLETAGGLNVAAQFPGMQNFPQYAQLNTERVVEANPDVILIMTHGSSEDVKNGFVNEMELNTAWSSISAVRNKRIHVLPAELFGTNPGTKVVDAVKLLEELLAS